MTKCKIYVTLCNVYIAFCHYITFEVIAMKNKVSKVKLARVQSDLTQAQLAEKAGVTRQTIGLIEAGKFNPSLRLCLAIARALNKTLDDLFWIEEEENGQ